MGLGESPLCFLCNLEVSDLNHIFYGYQKFKIESDKLICEFNLLNFTNPINLATVWLVDNVQCYEKLFKYLLNVNIQI